MKKTCLEKILFMPQPIISVKAGLEKTISNVRFYEMDREQ